MKFRTYIVPRLRVLQRRRH